MDIQQPKYVTEDMFEKAMNAIFEEFSYQRSINETFTQEFRAIRFDIKQIQVVLNDLSILVHRHDYRIDNHTERIENIETKLKQS